MLLMLGCKWTSHRQGLELYTWKVCCYSSVHKYSSLLGVQQITCSVLFISAAWSEVAHTKEGHII
jgi:hypothetical protein